MSEPTMPRGFHATGALMFAALTGFDLWLGYSQGVLWWGVLGASTLPFALTCAFTFCWLRVGRGTTGGTDGRA